MKNLTWQNPEQLFVAQVLINKVKSKCCGIKVYEHTVAYTNETELRVVANDLEACEKYRLSLLPPRRRTIYAMSRFEDKSISDISAELNLSHRTVENHLRIGRHEVREFIKQCI